jgi:hypothetical protein
VPASSALDICGALGVDGVVVGALSLDTYVMLEVEPGPHRVTIVTAESQHTLEVSADEGDNVFLEALPKMVWPKRAQSCVCCHPSRAGSASFRSGV